MYCSNCGNKVEHDDHFCIKCGTKLNVALNDNKETLDQAEIEEIIKDINEGLIVSAFSLAEKEALVRVAIKKQDPQLALNIFKLDEAQKYKLSQQEKTELKWIILKTKNADIFCFALLNLRNNDLRSIFTDPERKTLRDIASKTPNAWWAYNIYRNECHNLVNEKENREALRKTVIGTNDPRYAFEFLIAQEENLESYDEDLKSLEFSREELERFKQVILSSQDADIAYKLLFSKEFSKEQTEKAERDPEMFDYSFPSVIELTPDEQNILKRIILESKNPYCAYYILSGLRGNTAAIFTDKERALLREILVQTTNPTVARGVLSNPTLSQGLSQEERAHLGAQSENSKKREEIKNK